MATWTTVDLRKTDDRHTRPLDSLLQALTEAECGTCQTLLAMIKVHPEISIPAWPKGAAW